MHAEATHAVVCKVVCARSGVGESVLSDFIVVSSDEVKFLVTC